MPLTRRARPAARPSSRSRRRAPAAAAALLATLGLLAGTARAERPHAAPAVAVAAPAPASPEYLAAHKRWAAAMEAFAQADKGALPAENGVLFVGSSTVRMWSSLAQDFREWPGVINRGFGGSTLHECRLLARELVLRYRPRHVLVYAGDNDLAQGRTPLQVMDDFVAFARNVRAELPQARISFISIKPSPSRAQLLSQVQLANELVAAYLRTQANVDFIDIYTPMTDAQGRARPELFLKDQLHLNAAGYRLWHDVIKAQLSQDTRPAHEAASAAGDATADGSPAGPADLALPAAEARPSGEAR